MDQLVMELNSLDETLERWFLELDFHKALEQNVSETVPVSESLDRVTAKPVFAELSSPSFYSASIDGIALVSARTFGVSENNPLVLKLGEDAHFIDTGRVMPQGFDSVIPIDMVTFRSIEEVEVRKYCAPWENVRPVGEEISARELIIPANSRIRPLDIAAMAVGGVTKLEVIRKPRVAIVPVGSSLVPAGTEPRPGKQIETSSQILSNTIIQYGCEPLVMDIVPETIENLISAGSSRVEDVDFIIVIAGPSLGTRPFAEIINKRGDLVAYGVQLKPGMSSCFGVIDGKPIIGLPGYAMSSLVIFELFALPVLAAKLGIDPPPRKSCKAYLSLPINSPRDVSEFIRVTLGRVGDMTVATPISRGAHILMSLVRADGITRVPPDREHLEVGDSVNVELLRPDVNIDNKVLIAGTHDLCLDLLRNELQKNFNEISLFSSNVGSMKGLMALKAGYCHISSMHLFDDEAGEYNIPFVRKFLYDVPLILINLFYRRLGFIVAKGNPKKIKTFEDLARDDVRIINRIRGSGTRTVFDYYLRANHLDINGVKGYENEAHTHLKLASAVASGNADAGLGILEAARATGMDFVPVVPERLDFAVPKAQLDNYAVKCLLKVINSDNFKKEIGALGGYDVTHTGKVIYEK